MGRGLAEDSRAIIDDCLRQWQAEFRPRGIVPTVRQYFYLCAVATLVDKSEKGYGKVQRTLDVERPGTKRGGPGGQSMDDDADGGGCVSWRPSSGTVISS